MLKVLVADESLESNLRCCQYLLANDKNLNIVSSNSGINTLEKYHEINPNVLVINSNFKDMKYTEIINELSNTGEERHNCNIILTVLDSNKVEVDFMAKVYKLFYKLDYDKIYDGINQYNLDNIIFYEPSEKNLRALFYKLNLYNERLGSVYLKYAIVKCYHTPELLNSLNSIFTLISKEFNISYESIRPAMRNALKSVNNCRNMTGDKGIFKLFENEDSITPKIFIRTITTYYLKQKR
ncbi:MAG: hypothetical protein HFJ30_01745 [Clostridia bacterium]|nr:hypothetical protein [Clostridia bacterium]